MRSSCRYGGFSCYLLFLLLSKQLAEAGPAVAQHIHTRKIAVALVGQGMAQKPVFLELGVGFNTPGIIRYPFERIAAANPDAMLIRVNQGNAGASYIDLTNILSIQQDVKEAVDKLIRLIMKITVFEDHFTVGFKSGVTIEIKA